MRTQLRALIAPGLILLSIMSATIVLRSISVYFIQKDFQSAADNESRRVADLLKSYLNERMVALNHVALSLTIHPDTTADQFRTHASQTMEETPGITAIAVTDRDLTPRWLETGEDLNLEQFTAVLNTEQNLDALAPSIYRVAGDRKFVITEPLNFSHLGTGFAALSPYLKEGQEAGYVIGVFLYDRLVANLLSFEHLDEYNVTLDQIEPDPQDPEKYRSLYHRSSGSGDIRIDAEALYVSAHRAELGLQMWRVTVEPKNYGLSGGNPFYFTSAAILILGAVLSVLVSGMLYRHQLVALKSQREARQSRTRLASTSEDLARVTEELDLILNSVDEGIILYDEDLAPLQANAVFKTTVCSEGAQDLLETSAEDHHKRMAGLFVNEPRYHTLLNSLKNTPEESFTDEIEMKGANEDGGPRFFQRRATTVVGLDGARRGYLVIYQDITPARAVEKLKEDFLASVTHDLRTPLASIKGFAETMLRDGAMTRETRDEFTSIIGSEASRLQEMIEDLLDLRRMEEGKSDLKPATYNLKAVVEDVLRTSRPIFEPRDLRVDLHWRGDSSEPLMGDVGKISRAIRNLLSNSIKYSPAHSTIRIRGVEEEDRVELEVNDEGPGIPDEDMPHVFEKFYRGAMHVRKTQGTGLGLAIVKHIVESHGGLVSAFSAEGRGTTIRIVLPREFKFTTAEVVDQRAREGDPPRPSESSPPEAAHVG